MRLANHVKFREEAFGGVLFETLSEKVYTLSPSAAAVVQEIAAGNGGGDIAARLAQRFDAPQGAIERDVIQFVGELRGRGLVEG